MEQNGADHRQVLRLHTKSIQGTAYFKTGTGRWTAVEVGIQTPLQPLKHLPFGEQDMSRLGL